MSSNVYQIAIKSGEQWRSLDLGTDKLAWNIQVNDVAELKNRQANYSQNLKLPFTKNNCEIFGYAHLPDIQSEAPYKKFDCRLYCAENILSGEGSYLVLLKISNAFECQILSGIANLFDLMEEAPMSDLPLGSWTNMPCFYDPKTWPSTYRMGLYAPFTKNSDSRTKIAEAHQGLWGLGSNYPVLSVELIVYLMLASKGYWYTINKNVFADKYLSLAHVDVKATEEDIAQFEVIGGCRAGIFYTDKDLLDIVDTTGNFVYHAQFPCEVTVTMHASGSGFNFPVYVNNYSTDKAYIPAFDGYTWTQTFLLPDNNSKLNIGWRATASTENINCTIAINNIVNCVPSNVGATFDLSTLTGFDSQLACFKALVQAFGLTVSINNKRKEVRLFTFASLYDNISEGNVLDWSAKVDRNPNAVTTFSVKSYARKNKIKFEENSRDEITDEASFEVKNDALDVSKELFTIGFEAGQDIPFLVGNDASLKAQVPLMDLGEVTPGATEETQSAEAMAGATFNDIKPHLLSLGTYSNSYTPIRNLPDPPTYHNYISLNTLTAQDCLDSNYKELIDTMLNHARMVEDKFLLEPSDIEKFNPEIPVYIDKYGAYFYVNKIKNYQYGELTTVELVRL